MALSLEDVLNCDDSKKVELEVPEWKGSVYIRVLPGDLLGEFQALAMRTKEDPRCYSEMVLLMCSFALCDEDGKRLVPKGKEGALAKKSGVALNRVFSAAIELNKIEDDAVDDLEKNSSAIHSDDSGSVSPSPSDTPSENSNDE